VTLRDPDIAPTPPLDYVVRDRMGKVVQNHATPGGASLAVSRLDPGAFVAKGMTILGWHPATSKSQQREIRKLIGWPEPAPEFVPGAPPTPGHRTGIAFGAGARKPKVASGPPPATQPTPIATETTMATATKSETKPLCRKCQKRPVQPSRKNAKPEAVGLCKQCKIALYPSQIAKTKAPKAKAPPATGEGTEARRADRARDGLDDGRWHARAANHRAVRLVRASRARGRPRRLADRRGLAR
jgi:hypothetical protein